MFNIVLSSKVVAKGIIWFFWYDSSKWVSEEKTDKYKSELNIVERIKCV